jgi:hypothetical protein
MRLLTEGLPAPIGQDIDSKDHKGTQEDKRGHAAGGVIQGLGFTATRPDHSSAARMTDSHPLAASGPAGMDTPGIHTAHLRDSFCWCMLR